MKTTNRMRALSIILSLIMLLSVISFPSLKANAAGGVDGFVERCYTVTLGRGSDAAGFADWKDQLLNGKSVGVNIAYGFLFSAEYKNKNKSNEDYVKDLYKLFMDREPDQAGFNDWVGKLNNGSSREEVFAGFANSQEFYNICESYGITAGSFVVGYDRKQVNNVNLFVERLYQTCLGRRGDRGGQKDWVNKLVKKEITGVECARCFIQSKEYVNKGLSDDEFVENMYKAMMGRASDEGGKSNWLFALANGMTRDEVFAGFANSKEFGDICASYKIDKGSYTAKDKGTYDPNKQQNNNQNNNTNNNNQNNNTNNNNQNNQNQQNNNNNNQNNTEKKTGYHPAKSTYIFYEKDGSVIARYTDICTYDKNNEIPSKIETTDEDTGEMFEYTINVFDSKGFLSEHHEYYLSVDKYVEDFYAKRTYKCNDNGQIIEETSYNGKGEVSTVYKYNDKGVLIESDWYGDPDGVEKIIYTLDSFGYPFSGTYYWKDRYGVEHSHENVELFIYESNGNCIEKISYYVPGFWDFQSTSSIILTSGHKITDPFDYYNYIYSYEYDSHGNVIYEDINYWTKDTPSSMGGYNEIHKYEYKFNTRGDIVSITTYDDDHFDNFFVRSIQNIEYSEYTY